MTAGRDSEATRNLEVHMAKTYTTQQGDAWDLIAYRVYGSEAYTGWLMQHNFVHLDTMIFGAGVVLQTPELPKTDQTADLPPWRTQSPVIERLDSATEPAVPEQQTAAAANQEPASEVLVIQGNFTVSDDGEGNLTITEVAG